MSTDETKALGANAAEEILKHYGVKGMKWGVRRDRPERYDGKPKAHIPGGQNAGIPNSGKRMSNRKVRKLDAKFEKVGSKEWVAIHNRAAELSNAHDISRINNKPKWVKAAAEGKFLDENSKEFRLYEKEHQQAFIGRVKQAAKEMGTNASGTREYVIESEGWGWSVRTADVKHSVDDPAAFDVKVEYDDSGQVVGLKIMDPSEEAIKHVDDILEHYGTKGMKWGVRRSRKERREAAKRTPSEDFTNAQKLKKKKPFELSNQELKQLNDRLQQEQRLKQLSPSTVDRGHKQVKQLLALSATATTALALRKPVMDLGKQIIKYDESWV